VTGTLRRPRFVPEAMLPLSAASERNKEPILSVLGPALSGRSLVLEIGSGTGQHAVYFSRQLPHLTWQPTDRADNLGELATRVARLGPANLLAPLELDVTQAAWPALAPDAVFTANTLHIMAWPEVAALFAGLGRILAPGALLAIYGPFRYAGAHTAPSNEAFDRDLQARDPASGVRDFEAVDALAAAQDLTLEADHAMPANNRLLLWLRRR